MDAIASITSLNLQATMLNLLLHKSRACNYHGHFLSAKTQPVDNYYETPEA